MTPRYFAKWERLAAVDIAPMVARLRTRVRANVGGADHKKWSRNALTRTPAPVVGPIPISKEGRRA